jgi:hypothetical protein
MSVFSSTVTNHQRRISAHTLNSLTNESVTELNQVKVKVTLRLTIRQSASFGVESRLRLMTRYLLLCDSYGLVFLGRPL